MKLGYKLFILLGLICLFCSTIGHKYYIAPTLITSEFIHEVPIDSIDVFTDQYRFHGVSKLNMHNYVYFYKQVRVDTLKRTIFPFTKIVEGKYIKNVVDCATK